MYLLERLHNNVSLYPNELGSNINKRLHKKLKDKYTNKILGEKDIYIMHIIESYIQDNGVIDDMTSSVVFNVIYDVISFKPVIDEIIEIEIKFCNDLGIWGVLNELKCDVIECMCPNSYLNGYNYDEILEVFYNKDTKIMVGSIVSVKIVNFKINTNKIDILGRID